MDTFVGFTQVHCFIVNIFVAIHSESLIRHVLKHIEPLLPHQLIVEYYRNTSWRLVLWWSLHLSGTMRGTWPAKSHQRVTKEFTGTSEFFEGFVTLCLFNSSPWKITAMLNNQRVFFLDHPNKNWTRKSMEIHTQVIIPWTSTRRVTGAFPSHYIRWLTGFLIVGYDIK